MRSEILIPRHDVWQGLRGEDDGRKKKIFLIFPQKAVLDLGNF